MGPTKRGKGSKTHGSCGRPWSSSRRRRGQCFTSTEVRLVISTLEARFIPELPERLIGDKAYDSDLLDAELAEGAVELIAPNRSNRKVKTQDGRSLRRYRRRWKVERLFAWLHNFPPAGEPLGVRRHELLRLRPAGLHRHPAAEMFMRLLLLVSRSFPHTAVRRAKYTPAATREPSPPRPSQRTLPCPADAPPSLATRFSDLGCPRPPIPRPLHGAG